MTQKSALQIGVVFPQTEIGNDPLAIRDYAQAAEALGYTHVVAFDHVVGANPNRPGGWRGPYTFETPFHEPFVLFAYLAGVTQRLRFATGIIILPQRQTVLVAKQTATLDVLSGGRLRLGVGIGWNEVEYISLNTDFHTRGRRVEEQVALLRRLWTEPLVDVATEWHTIPDAGINPLPIQRPIPIWFGGYADAVVRRIATSGDGWFLNDRTADSARPHLAKLDAFLEQAGRSRADVGVEARIPYSEGGPEGWQALVDGWREVGATHISLNTMGARLTTPADHITALRTFAEAIPPQKG